MGGDLEMLLAVIGTGVALAALIMSQLSGLKRELRGEIADLRSEMRREIAELRSEMRGEIAKLHGEIAELRRGVNSLGNRVARLEGVIDMIRIGMQLPRPAGEAEEVEAA